LPEDKPVALEWHYSVSQLAALWGVSRATIRRIDDARTIMTTESFISDYQRKTKPLPVPAIYRRRGSLAWRCRLAPGGKAEVRVKLVDGELVLHFIGSAEHGKGYGTAALTWLCDLADKHQVPLILNVVGKKTSFGALRMTSGRLNDPYLTPKGLRAWYKRHGFVTYQRKAEGGVMMRRSPQPPSGLRRPFGTEPSDPSVSTSKRKRKALL
jgi:hypothetical protein